MEHIDKRALSNARAKELKDKTTEYREAKERIPQGRQLQEMFDASKKKLLQYFIATEADWKDWHWQLKHSISDDKILNELLELSEDDRKVLIRLSKRYRWAISPYYASLMNPKDPFGPIRMMSLPSVAELAYDTGELDPMGEECTNPAGSITRRYPDRLIINVTNQCANYCRFCQRRRLIGQADVHRHKALIEESLEYIRQNPEIRDVLITGGDALLLEDLELEWILSSVRAIPHVEIIRIGTRSLVAMPQRVTPALCAMLKKYHPLYINTHFNHPQEVTLEAKHAAELLADHGISVGNQMVLLNGINNDKYVVQCLNHELLKIRVRPYYIFHPKHVKGTSHFLCSIDDGLEIMEHLRGHTSGMAIPTYIVNAPGGAGKIPILPTYLVSREKNHVVIRTWEGKVFEYRNAPTKDIHAIIRQAREKMLKEFKDAPSAPSAG